MLALNPGVLRGRLADRKAALMFKEAAARQPPPPDARARRLAPRSSPAGLTRRRGERAPTDFASPLRRHRRSELGNNAPAALPGALALAQRGTDGVIPRDASHHNSNFSYGAPSRRRTSPKADRRGGLEAGILGTAIARVRAP